MISGGMANPEIEYHIEIAAPSEEFADYVINCLKYYEIPVIVVATKADKIPRGKWNKHESAIKKKLNFDKTDKFIIFSSVDRTGLDESWDSILEEL